MNFITAVKTIGHLTLKGAGVADVFIPLILKGIEIAEDIGNDDPETKPKKKEIAKDIVALGVRVVNQTVKKNELNESLITAVADNGIDLVVRAANELSRKRNK